MHFLLELGSHCLLHDLVGQVQRLVEEGVVEAEGSLLDDPEEEALEQADPDVELLVELAHLVELDVDEEFGVGLDQTEGGLLGEGV